MSDWLSVSFQKLHDEFNCILTVGSLCQTFIHYYSALQAGLAGTRAESCDRHGSGTLHPRQVLGGSVPLLSPAFRLFHFRRNDARDPNSETWNCEREIVR